MKKYLEEVGFLIYVGRVISGYSSLFVVDLNSTSTLDVIGITSY